MSKERIGEKAALKSCLFCGSVCKRARAEGDNSCPYCRRIGFKDKQYRCKSVNNTRNIVNRIFRGGRTVMDEISGLLSQIKFTPEFVLDFFPVEYGYDRG